jgi:hypothetical protein
LGVDRAGCLGQPLLISVSFILAFDIQLSPPLIPRAEIRIVGIHAGQNRLCSNYVRPKFLIVSFFRLHMKYNPSEVKIYRSHLRSSREWRKEMSVSMPDSSQLNCVLVPATYAIEDRFQTHMNQLNHRIHSLYNYKIYNVRFIMDRNFTMSIAE